MSKFWVEDRVRLLYAVPIESHGHTPGVNMPAGSYGTVKEILADPAVVVQFDASLRLQVPLDALQWLSSYQGEPLDVPELLRNPVPFDDAAAPPVADPVNHPSHYTQGKVECIDAIEAALGREQFIGFLRGQVFKYTWRCGLKDAAAQDHAKAMWYGARLARVLAEQS